MNDAGMSHSLIKMLLDRESYYKYQHFIKKHVLDDMFKIIIEDLDYYYCDYDADDKVNIEDFSIWFSNMRHSSFSDELLECYNELFKKIKKSKSEQVEKLINYFNVLSLRADVEQALQKENNVQGVIDICNEYLKNATLSSKFESFFQDMSSETEDQIYKDRQISWGLNCLNESIGKIGPGDFGIIFAGTNAGKTSFLCSEVSNMIKTLPGRVLWLYNEGSFVKLKYRFWSACLEINNTDIMQDINRAKRQYLDYCSGDIDKVRFCNSVTMSIYDVEHIVREIKPSLVVIDQLDNLTGFDKSQRDDIRALKLYQKCRGIAALNNCPILVTTQATDTEGDSKHTPGQRWYKRYLTKEHMQGSRIAKQSTAEFIIGIGYDANTPDYRYITTPKVKSLEGDNNNELQRTAWFQRSISKFKD
jgi:hypothetical protein